MPIQQNLSQQARSTYRQILRELPRRPLSTPSPLHQKIRQVFRSPPPSTEKNNDIEKEQEQEREQEVELEIRLAEASQLAQYARAQRTYAFLVEQYNPGINMDEEEKIRMTARRVGLDLPDQVSGSGNNKGSGHGQ